MSPHTIIEKWSDNLNYHCGYCSKDSACSKGIWAHSMNAIDYQALIDRGWRRSGSYCYKPIMDRTCCPQYTIRCHILDYKLSKSKKKVIKKMRDFLMSEGEEDIDRWRKRQQAKDSASSSKELVPEDFRCSQEGSSRDVAHSDSSRMKKEVSKGLGPDPTKPLCKKAKILRQERRKRNEAAAGDAIPAAVSKDSSLQTLILPHLQTESLKRKFEVRTVRAVQTDPEFIRYKSESFSVYKKYQTTIHKDDPSDCTERQWLRFLVDCPLNRDPSGPGMGYGNYHQHYVVDGKIIAVGVIDILPNCVSSVYLYYDPDYGFLSMGVYTALSEIAFAQSLHLESAELKYYYMGFYIHNCQKMKYKREHHPSELLCPETYHWVPVELCLDELDKHKYYRLNVLNGGSPTTVDAERGSRDKVDGIAVLYRRRAIRFIQYAMQKYPLARPSEAAVNPAIDRHMESMEKIVLNEEMTELEDYLAAVGMGCAYRMLLYRESGDGY